MVVPKPNHICPARCGMLIRYSAPWSGVWSSETAIRPAASTLMGKLLLVTGGWTQAAGEATPIWSRFSVESSAERRSVESRDLLHTVTLSCSWFSLTVMRTSAEPCDQILADRKAPEIMSPPMEQRRVIDWGAFRPDKSNAQCR